MAAGGVACVVGERASPRALSANGLCSPREAASDAVAQLVKHKAKTLAADTFASSMRSSHAADPTVNSSDTAAQAVKKSCDGLSEDAPIEASEVAGQDEKGGDEDNKSLVVTNARPVSGKEANGRGDGSCSTDVSTATTAASSVQHAGIVRRRRRPPTASVAVLQQDSQSLVCELAAQADDKRKWMQQHEDGFKQRTERLAQLKREVEALTETVEQSEARRREHQRVERLLRGRHAAQNSGGIDSDDASSSSGSSSTSDDGGDGRSEQEGGKKAAKRRRRSRRERSGLNRERKRLRRFRSELALRFQLLQAECQRSELQVDKLVTDLRREYTDSYLFAGPLLPPEPEPL